MHCFIAADERCGSCHLGRAHWRPGAAKLVGIVVFVFMVSELFEVMEVKKLPGIRPCCGALRRIPSTPNADSHGPNPSETFGNIPDDEAPAARSPLYPGGAEAPEPTIMQAGVSAPGGAEPGVSDRESVRGESHHTTPRLRPHRKQSGFALLRREPHDEALAVGPLPVVQAAPRPLRPQMSGLSRSFSPPI